VTRQIESDRLSVSGLQQRVEYKAGGLTSRGWSQRATLRASVRFPLMTANGTPAPRPKPRRSRVKSLRGMVVIGAGVAIAAASGIVAATANHVVGGSSGF
jgi:hypothetical protein